MGWDETWWNQRKREQGREGKKETSLAYRVPHARHLGNRSGYNHNIKLYHIKYLRCSKIVEVKSTYIRRFLAYCFTSLTVRVHSIAYCVPLCLFVVGCMDRCRVAFSADFETIRLLQFDISVHIMYYHSMPREAWHFPYCTWGEADGLLSPAYDCQDKTHRSCQHTVPGYVLNKGKVDCTVGPPRVSA